MVYSLWILISAWLVCTGLILSALNQLNVVGYLISLGALVISLYLTVRFGKLSHLLLLIRWRRFKKPLPLAFLIIVLMVLAGAILHPPTQYDGLCYRVPRMLHWLSEGRWHWIHTCDTRMNISATGMEWITMPILVLTRSDHWLWIPDFFSFLLMPGLVFGTFRRLGVSLRASWSWMWILPSGYCFVTQAGSIGNDLTALPFALGSVYFALRARDGNYWFLALAILSTALLTGIKASNIPLALPALVAALPAFPLLWRKPVSTIGVLFISVVVSFIPMAMINQYQEGHWSGDRDNSSRMQLQSPSAGLIGNGIMITLSSLQPPILPSGSITEPLVKHLLGEGRFKNLQDAFPRFNPGLGEIAVEEGSGLGLGVMIALLAAVLLQFRTIKYDSVERNYSTIILLSGWIALMTYMMMMGSESCARLVTPYYPICFFGVWVLLVRRQGVVRQPVWKWIAVVAMLMAIPVLVLSPARPLWPAQTILGIIDHKQGSRLIKRAKDVYSVYQNRNKALASVAEALPHDVSVIGLAGGGGDLETSLWWPMGSRKIVHILPGDDPVFLKQKGVEVICSNTRILSNDWKMTPEQFTAMYYGKIIARPKATETVGWGEERWVVVDLRDALKNQE